MADVALAPVFQKFSISKAILLPAKDEACSAFLIRSTHPFGRDADEAQTRCYLPFRIAR